MRRGKYKRKILEMHWKLRDQQLKQSCVYIYTVIEEEKLKFYITPCSFCFCNSAYSLQSLDHVGHVGSESGDLKYQELEFISLTPVLLFAIAQPLQTCLIMPVCVRVRYSPHHLDCYSCACKASQFQFTSVQFSSLTQSCPTLCDPMIRSTPGLPVHHKLLESTQIHAHRVGDTIQPSHPLSSPSPPAPNPSQHQGLFR